MIKKFFDCNINFYKEDFFFYFMKGVFVILDGLGDLPIKQFGNKTPIEAAKTPRLDFLATRGEMGYQYPVKVGYVPGSDEAVVSIFGNDLKSSSRGQLEAWGSDLTPKKGDIALRVNFATIDTIEGGNVIDRRAGRTLQSKEAKELAKAVNEIDFPYKFKFVATCQHRGVLVISGDFSDKITGDDITYTKGNAEEIRKIVPCRATVKNENAIHTADVLNEFLILAYDVLRKHSVNKERKRKGLLPANYLLVRGPGVEKPKLKQHKKWVSANYMSLEIGFSKLSGMQNFSFNYPALKGIDSYDNLWSGLRKAVKHSIKVVKKNLNKADYCYIHIKETDLPGHDNKPIEKLKMIEYIDKTLFKFLARICPMKKIHLVVTGDHSTPCKLKNHSADPVPVLFYNGSIPSEKKTFGETEARKGKLGKMVGGEMLRKVGFVK